MLSDQELVEALDALRPPRLPIPVLIGDPRPAHVRPLTASLRLQLAPINGVITTPRQTVTKRALIHTQLRGDTPNAAALIAHKHLRAHQVPLRQPRQNRLPSTRNVPGNRPSQCGKVGVP